MKNKKLLTRFFFPKLQEAEREILLARLHFLSMPKGAVLLRENEEALGLILITKGSLSVSKRTPDGSHVEIGIIGANSLLGEVSIFSRQRISATVTAREDIEGYLLHREQFEALDIIFPHLSQVIIDFCIKIISDRMEHTLDAMLLHVDDKSSHRSVVPQRLMRLPPRNFKASTYAILRYIPYLKSDWELSEFTTRDELDIGMQATYQYFKKNQIIFQRDVVDNCDAYFVLFGCVQEGIINPVGIMKTGFYRPGMIFGVREFFLKKPRITTCFARENTVLMVLPKLTLSQTANVHKMLQFHKVKKAFLSSLCLMFSKLVDRERDQKILQR